MEISKAINIAVGCVVASRLKMKEKQEVIDSLRKLELESIKLIEIDE